MRILPIALMPVRAREVMLRADVAEVVVTTIRGLVTNADRQYHAVVTDAAPLFDQLQAVQDGAERVGRAVLRAGERRRLAVTLPLPELVALTRFIRAVAHSTAPFAYSALQASGITPDRLSLLLLAVEEFEAALLVDTIEASAEASARRRRAERTRAVPEV